MRCLVVDDSATMRRIVANALHDIGYADVVEATDGRDALAKCDGTIELVITDWNMPVMSGLELVRHLRADERTAKVPIIMITARAGKDDILQAVDAGISNYILKPFTPELLKKKIDQVVSLTSDSA